MESLSPPALVAAGRRWRLDRTTKMDGSCKGRMKVGTARRVRDLPMRHGTFHPGTRDFRGRFLPTKHGHAGSARTHVRVTREYQSDSSSKRPASSVPWDSRPVNPEEEGLLAGICWCGVVRGGMMSPRRGRVGVTHSGASARPRGSVEGPRLMGAPRSVCPAMDNPRTCLPRAVLGARGNPQILLRGKRNKKNKVGDT